MKTKRCAIAPDDDRAKDKIRENLKAGSKTLGCKLLARYSDQLGEIFAIAREDLDIESLSSFSNVAYHSDKYAHAAAKSNPTSADGWPIDALITFLAEFLRNGDDRVVIIQNALWQRSSAPWKDPIRQAYSLPTRHAFFEEEVYHILTAEDVDPALVEETIRESWHFWFVGICAERTTISPNSLLTEESIDELAAHTRYIFVPAFDDEGFLVWAPTLAD